MLKIQALSICSCGYTCLFGGQYIPVGDEWRVPPVPVFPERLPDEDVSVSYWLGISVGRVPDALDERSPDYEGAANAQQNDFLFGLEETGFGEVVEGFLVPLLLLSSLENLCVREKSVELTAWLLCSCRHNAFSRN